MKYYKIPGFSIYEITKYGLIRSIHRFDSLGREKIGGLIIQELSNEGYYRVTLFKNDKRYKLSVHVLVGITFCDYDAKSNNVWDHIDCNKINNYYKNIQSITSRENTVRNMPLGISGQRGVHAVKDKWRAVISINNKKCHLGYFNTVIEAVEAYNNKLKTINHG